MTSVPTSSKIARRLQSHVSVSCTVCDNHKHGHMTTQLNSVMLKTHCNGDKSSVELQIWILRGSCTNTSI